MSRPPRIEYPGASYYISGRALQSRDAFVDAKDFASFKSVLAGVVDRFGWELKSFVLLPDHYHLILEVPHSNLSKGMRQLNGVYTQLYNRRHGTEGPVFHGRFKSVVFEKESFLLPIVRHAALNPVRVRAAKAPANYRHSSYPALVREAPVPEMLSAKDIYSAIGSRDPVASLRQYVEQDEVEGSPLDHRAHQILLGGDDFIDRMQKLLKKTSATKPAPKIAGRRKSLKMIFRGAQKLSRTERNERIRSAHIDYGYTLAEIGAQLDLHYTTVSKVINASAKRA